jgi:outer membrane protein insertion porin family
VNGNPTGGEWVLTGSLEYEMPLVKDVLGVVAFADGGTLGTALGEDDAWRLRLSVGGGIRLRIPFLGPQPMAIDFGFPLVWEDEDERQLVSFTVGKDF